MTAGLYSNSIAIIFTYFTSSSPTVRGVGDAAVPEAGAALVPAAVPVTAGRGHAPIPALAPSRTRPARRSPSLLPGPNPGLVPEAAHLRRTEAPSPGQGLKANRNLLGKKGLHPKNSSLVRKHDTYLCCNSLESCAGIVQTCSRIALVKM